MTASILHHPIQVGDLTLPNRIIMAPLTRCRSTPDRVPTPLMAEYYRQRASAGLILSEATAVDPMGVGYPDTPGIWNDAQVRGWRKVTTAVHEAGGRIFLQLWHVGRISHPSYLNGAQPVAPSALAADGFVSHVRPKVPYPTPRALETSELPGVLSAYRRAGNLAREAGFDGVEIHGANGYLLDQFLLRESNHRTDAYGGSLENRVRLLLEVAETLAEIWGPGRVGVHLAPRPDRGATPDEAPGAAFLHAAEALGRLGLAFLCTREGLEGPRLSPAMKDAFGGILVANQGFTKTDAEQEIQAGRADAVAWGRLFIANPDLPERFARNHFLNEPENTTFYGVALEDKAQGYTDYPFMSTDS